MKNEEMQDNSSPSSRSYLLQVIASIFIVFLAAFGFIPLADHLGLNIRWATATIGVVSLLGGLEVMAWAKFGTFRWSPIFTRWQNIIAFICLLTVYSVGIEFVQNSPEFTWGGLIVVILFSTIYLTVISLIARYLKNRQ